MVVKECVKGQGISRVLPPVHPNRY
jgi:hypothetical protein